MHGSIPAAAIVAVIFLLWDLYDLFECIKEYRKKSSARRASSRRVVVGMIQFKMFMSAASVANAVVHVAEAL